ncbi:MAG TPA: ParB/RepB/Spo0J family partition protein [Candidatus Hydrogenedentes bacterium]|nr:ParB/RepB/Spo0J family partition protein [Candidatus Hydrogenedentota bacterium]
MANPKKGGLGRGLGALISNPVKPVEQSVAASAPAVVHAEEPNGDRILYLDPHAIKPNPKQPRMHFSEEGLEELAASIRREGVQEPVIVRKQGNDFELVSGERRVRATIMAGLETVPAICREVSDSDMLRLGLVENIQRENLNAVELAKAYQMLIDEFNWTQEQLADEVGKKRATVANTLRLLNLPGDVQARVADESISMGHARALLALSTPAAMSAACRRVVQEGLSVRQAEKLATPQKPKGKSGSAAKDPNLQTIEDQLRRRLATRVSLRPSSPTKGKIEIEYFTLDDLERILDILKKS